MESSQTFGIRNSPSISHLHERRPGTLSSESVYFASLHSTIHAKKIRIHSNMIQNTILGGVGPHRSRVQTSTELDPKIQATPSRKPGSGCSSDLDPPLAASKSCDLHRFNLHPTAGAMARGAQSKTGWIHGPKTFPQILARIFYQDSTLNIIRIYQKYIRILSASSTGVGEESTASCIGFVFHPTYASPPVTLE
jgi:hypothetical protein